MRAVLYTNDMEPITVIELPQFAYNHLSVHGSVALACYVPIKSSAPPDQPALELFPVVRVRCEILKRKGRDHMMLFTEDDEHALLLESVLLPGQHRNVQRRESDAFAQGFLDALSRLGAA